MPGRATVLDVVARHEVGSVNVLVVNPGSGFESCSTELRSWCLLQVLAFLRLFCVCKGEGGEGVSNS